MPEWRSPLDQPSQHRWWTAHTTEVIVGAVLLASLLLKLYNLDHQAVTYWDEAFHALVARNLLHHPLKPTLVERPALPYDPQNWLNNHVWLHKPILPLWQIMLTYAVLGVNTFALRLPSAVLSTGAVWLTYRIGKESCGVWAGLIAATLQAFTPTSLLLVHGYLFSDQVDISLLFWVEVGVYGVVRAMRTGRWPAVLLAGVAQGLAYLSKSYPAAIITGLACAAWLLPRVRLGQRRDSRLRVAHLVGLLSVTGLTIAPWTLFCLRAYPTEFAYEHAHVWAHLDTAIHRWGAPWDRLLFTYAINLAHVFYIPALVAACVLLWKAWTEHHTHLWLLYAWALGVLIPHTLALTKTPSATLIALPPFFLLLGVLISEAWQGKRWAWALWLGAMGLSLFSPDRIHPEGMLGDGYRFVPSFSSAWRQVVWLVVHVGGAGMLAGLLELAVWAQQRWGGVWSPSVAAIVRWSGLGGATVGMCLLGSQMVQAAWEVIQLNKNEPTFTEIARFAQSHLPPHAVLLFVFDESDYNMQGEHLVTMLHTDRPCYRIPVASLQAIACQVMQHGGIPYVVSQQELSLPLLFSSPRAQRGIYTGADVRAECAHR